MNLFKKDIILILILNFVAFSSGISLYKSDNQEFTLDEVSEKWTKLDGKLKNITTSAIDNTLEIVISFTRKLDLSPLCKKQNEHLVSGLKNLRPWAIRFLDSSGKLPDGVMEGITYAMGSYDECLDTVAVSNESINEGVVRFEGQYCSLNFKPYLPKIKDIDKLPQVIENLNFIKNLEIMPKVFAFDVGYEYLDFRLGVCMPSGCTVEDADKIAKYMGDSLYILGKAIRCESKESKKVWKLYPAGIFSLLLCSFIMLIVVTGSVMDIVSRSKSISYTHILHRILLCFSFPANFRKLINVENQTSFACLNGIRFFSMIWIVVGHTYLMIDFKQLIGIFKVRSYVTSFIFQPIVNGIFAVDTFFVIGGLLSCYGILNGAKTGSQKFSVLMYIFHRLWRILPLYVLVLMVVFQASLVELGPVWPDYIADHVDTCYTSWWKNLLFINNFIYVGEKMCLLHTWYLACDFQLYLLALLIFIPLLRSSRAGIMLSVLGIMASIISSMVVTFVNGHPLIPAGSKKPEAIQNFAWQYFRPYVHLGPYCVGILAGYILATKPKIKIPKIVQVIGWCLSFVCIVGVLFGVVEWNKGTEPSMTENLIYAGFSRTSFGIASAWVIICCTTGHGGWLNTLLSSTFFTPLARLTFAMYLVHPFTQMIFYGHLTSPIPVTHIMALWMFLGNIFTSFLLAFGASMLIEAPFLALEKVIFRRHKKSSPENPPEVTIEQNGHVKRVEETLIEEILAKSFGENANGQDKKEGISTL